MLWLPNGWRSEALCSGISVGFTMTESRRSSAAPIVGVGVVVIKDGCVLLIRRAKLPKAGEWSLPGGRTDWGERLRETAAREVFEETGIEAEIGVLLDVVDYVERNESGEVLHHFALVDYLGYWRGGEPVAGDDAAEARWAPLDRLAEYGLWTETLRVIRLGAERAGG